MSIFPRIMDWNPLGKSPRIRTGSQSLGESEGSPLVGSKPQSPPRLAKGRESVFEQSGSLGGARKTIILGPKCLTNLTLSKRTFSHWGRGIPAPTNTDLDGAGSAGSRGDGTE